MHHWKACEAGSSCCRSLSKAGLLYLILCKLGTACACLAVPIKNPKEYLLRIAPKTPVYTDRILQWVMGSVASVVISANTQYASAVLGL